MPDADTAHPAPDRPLFVLGDVHGRLDLLERAMGQVADRIAVLGHRDVQIVCVGDYVDRGPDSRGVIAGLMDFERQLPGIVTCLMGNHETMLLDFVDRPAERGRRFLGHGGQETLASYGIRGLDERSSGAAMAEGAARLRAALGEGLDWLRGRPLWHRSGDVVCVHAAMDPGKAPDAQEPRVMLWGAAAFQRRARRDGLWVVHGHTVVDAPQIRDRRIAIDTGAYFSDRLSVAVMVPDTPVEFLTIGA